MTRLAPAMALMTTLVSLCVAVILGEVYQFASHVIAPEWMAAASINSIIGIVVFARIWHRDRLLISLGLRQAYLPAFIVLFGSILLAKLTAEGDTVPMGTEQAVYFVASIAWIPVIEELVFRGGISPMLRAKVGPLWASWFSALIFTMVHGTPTLERLAHGQVGFALGAFLLGICCEALLYWSGSLLPGIAFHAACNATVMIFGVISPKWLDWLGPLYLK